MNKKTVIIILLFIFFVIGGYFLYNYMRIKYAKIEVTLVENLNLEFNDKKRVSDFIKDINGKIIDSYIIDSTKLGNKNIHFKFINNDDIKVSYTFKVKIVDTVSPVIWLGSSYSVIKDSNIDLTGKILCRDNYDNNPNCYIEGEYDLKTVGDYPLTFKATDNSGNTTEKRFILKVKEASKDNNLNSSPTYTYFSDVRTKYKNDNTKIGIDVSSWQGDIDFEQLKNVGVDL